MPELTYLSLGWGVQSWTIAAMVALGDLPPIDLAIHADTGHEPQRTYDHAAKWTPWLEERGLTVVTVKPVNQQVIREDWGIGSVHIPAFTLAKSDGSHGQIRRQCTKHWKLQPIRAHLRTLLSPRPAPGAVECWQGISLDEYSRMRSSDVKYIENVYPLVDRRMSRGDCIAWLQGKGLDVPPKSSCVFCPYHSLSAWRDLKAQGGPDWDKAVYVDQNIRARRNDFRLFVHPARQPLEEAVRIPSDYGAEQLELGIPCDGGVCFV